MKKVFLAFTALFFLAAANAQTAPKQDAPKAKHEHHQKHKKNKSETTSKPSSQTKEKAAK